MLDGLRADAERMRGLALLDPEFLTDQAELEEAVSDLEDELQLVLDRLSVLTAGLLPILLQDDD
jgi:hypothetical protein